MYNFTFHSDLMDEIIFISTDPKAVHLTLEDI